MPNTTEKETRTPTVFKSLAGLLLSLSILLYAIHLKAEFDNGRDSEISSEHYEAIKTALNNNPDCERGKALFEDSMKEDSKITYREFFKLNPILLECRKPTVPHKYIAKEK